MYSRTKCTTAVWLYWACVSLLCWTLYTRSTYEQQQQQRARSYRDFALYTHSAMHTYSAVHCKALFTVCRIWMYDEHCAYAVSISRSRSASICSYAYKSTNEHGRMWLKREMLCVHGTRNLLYVANERNDIYEVKRNFLVRGARVIYRYIWRWYNAYTEASVHRGKW